MDDNLLNPVNIPDPLNGFSSSPEPVAKTFVVRRLLRVWRRHLPLFAITAVTVLVLGGAIVYSLKPNYTATAVVTVSPPDANPLASADMQAAGRVDDADAATDGLVMQSREVAAAVLSQFPPPESSSRFHFIANFCKTFFNAGCGAGQSAELKQQHAIDKFLDSLAVIPQQGSSIINVSVTANTAARSALLANAVVANYQRMDLARQSADLTRVSNWLDGRTAELRQRWDDAEIAANMFRIQYGLTETVNGQTVAPLVDTEIATTADNLEAAQSRLAMAQAQVQTLHQAARAGDPTALIAQPEQPALVATRSTLTQLENSRDQLAAEFGESYPKLVAINRQIASTRDLLNGQTGVALDSVRQSSVSSQFEVQQLTNHLNQLRDQAAKQSGYQNQYLTLTQEAASAQTTYNTFLDHANGIVDREALLKPSVVLVSSAGIPSAASFPNKSKLAFGILLLALAAGWAAMLIRDYFSTGFDEVSDLRASVYFPLLATLPYINKFSVGSISKPVPDEMFSHANEAVRGLSLKLSLLADKTMAQRSVLITSAVPFEGKSTLAVWLATMVQQAGHSVLLIDGDHRCGTLMQEGAKLSKLGFSDLLSQRASISEVVQKDPMTAIDFISAGSQMTRPLGIDDVTRLRAVLSVLKQSYSLIIIDSPPLLAMSDGFAYSAAADQTIFVCRALQTSKQAVTNSLNLLRSYGANVVGIVVSMSDRKSTLTYGGEYSNRDLKLISRFYGSRA